MRKRKDPNAWFQQALKVSADPAASDWLKGALVAGINRDPVDAAADADVLYRILQLRAAAVQQGSARPDNRRQVLSAIPSTTAQKT
jgi:hypothetical protein